MKRRFNFDRDYFNRYYRNPKTRVCTPAERAALCAFVMSYSRHLLGHMPRSVLDLGCGLGHWRKEVARHNPRARYTGVEVSEYLCRRHGWEHASASEYAPSRSFDLVICQGVLQYLRNTEAERAIRNIAGLCASVLYFETLTRRDAQTACDPIRTDTQVYTRSGAWYRKRLTDDFHNAGGGVWVKRDTDVAFFELEVLE